MNKLVSIISPCYNGAKYVKQFLDSVLTQTYPAIELIFIDDASTDETFNIINSYVPLFAEKGYSLLYKRMKINCGQAAAINVGLQLFSGDYVAWMDSDDILYCDAIVKKVAFLCEKNVDFVISAGEVVLENNLDKPIGRLERKVKKQDSFFKDLLDEHNVVYGPGTILVKTEFLKTAIPDLHIFESREGQNWQLMLPIVYSGKAGYLSEVLFKYVVHEDSHSHISRTYEEVIKRRDNFYVLQKETILKIPTMPSSEKDYWLSYIYNRMLISKLNNAIVFNRYDEYKEYKKQLIERNVKLDIGKSYLLFQLLSPVRKLYGIMVMIIKKVLI